MTCNPDWPEIRAQLKPGQQPWERPDLISRVFRGKVDELISLLKDKHILGVPVSFVYVIEFQKRGLPHVHLLLILDKSSKITTAAMVDRVVCAELPDPATAPLLHAIISRHNIHGPCGDLDPNCVCMKTPDGRVDQGLLECSKSFPKEFSESTIIGNDSYPVYRRRDNGRTISKTNTAGTEYQLDNTWVVPYNPFLSLYFNCHLNVEVCSSISAVKYLFKYVYKGPDRAMVAVADPNQPVDEINSYQDVRYICASEAFWRIYGLGLHEETPTVCRLPVHLPGQHLVAFKEDTILRDLVAFQAEQTTHSPLDAWLDYNLKHEDGRHLLYFDFPSEYTYNPQKRLWTRRKVQQSFPANGRMFSVSPKDTERFYLRVLLAHVPGATSFEFLRTVDGVLHSTFQDACRARGLCFNDAEWVSCLQEAVLSQTPKQLRRLFVLLLAHSLPADPDALWTRFHPHFCEDFVHHAPDALLRRDPSLAATFAEFQALHEIACLLAEQGRRFDGVSFPLMFSTFMTHETMLHSVGFSTGPQERNRDFNAQLSEELDYDCNEQNNIFVENSAKLTAEERGFVDAVLNPAPDATRCHLLLAPAGTGKSFVFKTILAAIRSKGKVAIALASSGIAALLLPGGRTAHSVFKIPIDITDTSSCSISKQSKQADLMRAAEIFIWDEAPMMSRYTVEAVDRMLRDVCGVNAPFGGKTFVLGGDYRQILPVCKRGSGLQSDSMCLMASPLWKSFASHSFTINMRVQSARDAGSDASELEEFCNFLLSIGNGTYPSFIGAGDRIELPRVCTIPVEDGGEPGAWENLLHFVYNLLPAKLADWRDGRLTDAEYAQYITERSILCPTNASVGFVNDLVHSFAFPSDSEARRKMLEVLSFDSASDIEGSEWANDANLPVEFLNSLTIAGLPPHKLQLIPGMALMLIRNLDPLSGLCNGTRLVLKSASKYLLTCVIATPGPFLGNVVHIPRVKLISKNSGLPFEICRLQFPVLPSWSMTINKSQGQTMSIVGLYLDTQCFAHGQLYVALSRAQAISRIAIMSIGSRPRALPDGHVIRNVVQTAVLKAALRRAEFPHYEGFPASWARYRWEDSKRPPPPPR